MLKCFTSVRIQTFLFFEKDPDLHFYSSTIFIDMGRLQSENYALLDYHVSSILGLSVSYFRSISISVP